MGFIIPSNIINLTFDQYPGMEVRVSSIPLGLMLELVDGAEELRGGKLTGSQGSNIRHLFETFASNLHGWNCEYAPGHPVPADLDGLLSMDARFSSDLMLAWFDTISGGDLDKGNDPLERGSMNGSPSAAPNFPTEALSENPQNWPTQTSY